MRISPFLGNLRIGFVGLSPRLWSKFHLRHSRRIKMYYKAACQRRTPIPT
jgi:hypothetical protein